MSMQPPIQLEAVSKCYRIFESPQARLRQALRDQFRLGPPSQDAARLYREHWALRDVSFELRAGEAVGVLGRNGAGKSTLLQIIAGTLEPSSGSAQTHGRVTALLELGSGFNQEFTGLENVRLNAQILGLSSSETDRHMDEILAFADIGDFVSQPVKIYSTGMLMRLAFAVQTVLEPDVLIVDEALSVGDARFQEKCFRKLQSLREQGTTILLVSHDVNAVTSFCDRALLLENGHLTATGSAREISKVYVNRLYALDAPAATEGPATQAPESGHGDTRQLAIDDFLRFGTGAVKILQAGVYDATGRPAPVLVSGQSYRIAQKVLVREPLAALSSGFLIRNQRGIDIFGITNQTAGVPIEQLRPGDVVELHIDFQAWLAAGDYFLQAANATADGTQLDCHIDAFHFKVVETPELFTTSIVNMNPHLGFVVANTAGTPAR